MKLIIKKKPDAHERSFLAFQYEYYLEDEYGNQVDFGRGLRDLKLEMSVHAPNDLTLHLMLDDVDIDAEFLAQIVAHIGDKEDGVKFQDITTASDEIRTVQESPGGE